ncbi:hypothetical protein AB0I28_32120 [Phytomonospora sp. NPDC050363]|uniref:hypothetical protein n=1 Tax=Phytomonospora sp. NPDC050363 TaxID=3155642 RepID=UPI0033D29D1B
MPHNEILKGLRTRLPAGRNTQAAVAEAVAAIIEADENRPAGVTADYVSKLERGLITWPHEAYRRAFRQLFGVASDDALGFYSTMATAPLPPPMPPTASRHDVDDHQVQTGLVTLAAWAAHGGLSAQVGDVLAGGTEDTTIPHRIGMDDVLAIRQATRTFEEFDFAWGGGMSRAAVLAQLAWARQVLVRSRFTQPVRTALQSAIAHLGEVAGWMSFDVGQAGMARRCWLLALEMAAEAGDWPMRVNILTDMAREAAYGGRVTDALNLLAFARGAHDHLTPTILAATHVVSARAHGRAGASQECLRHIGLAEELCAGQDLAAEPDWMSYYDIAQLTGDTGHALFDLARASEPGSSVAAAAARNSAARLARAAELHGPEASRSRAFDQTKLATLCLVHGDRQEGVATAARALDGVPRIRSVRLVDDLRYLAKTGSAITGNADVGEMTQQVKRAIRARAV